MQCHSLIVRDTYAQHKEHAPASKMPGRSYEISFAKTDDWPRMTRDKKNESRQQSATISGDVR